MRYVSNEKLVELQENPSRVRNICIMAHVDHGKTTLADSLVASNGIISSKLAGKLRYLDSRPDEQQRGITMKSSSIALSHVIEEKEYLVNLIDSPGHVDFASEVSTAVRLCDGAIVIVDVAEGVCPQTRSALAMSYAEGLKPVLVLNKIDRLVTEMRLTPLDAYIHLAQVLEQINAVMGELFASDMMEREDREEKPKNEDEDWQSALFDADDANLYFSPEQGNVLFASAVDGWAFGVKEFARIFADKLGFSERVLLKTLWGDYYMNMKAKRISKGAQEKAKKPLFVSLILENLWSIYDTVVVRRDREKIVTMVEKMNIKLTTRDMRLTDAKSQLQAICSQWLPLSVACLNMVCEKIPSPIELTNEKIERLMSGNSEFTNLPTETQRLKDAFLACDASNDAPVIAFVSKMFSVERKSLPENKSKLLTREELEERREKARQRHAEKMSKDDNLDVGSDASLLQVTEDSHSCHAGNSEDSRLSIEETKDTEEEEEEEEVLVAFARIYSGTISVGSELYVLGPKHDPRRAIDLAKSDPQYVPPNSLRHLNPGTYVTKFRASKLYILMGRELIAAEKISAGNVFGMGGLEDHVLKTATLSKTLACPSFTELTSLHVPILRVALEPKHSKDLQKLINGLKLLNQADACALMCIQETGEIVLNTAGEVHLERCLEDLKNRYAKVEINVSEPIVSFRETVVPPPSFDMVNETIEKKIEELSLEAWTANRQCSFLIDAKPLPEKVTKLLESNDELMKELDLHWERYDRRDNSVDDENVEMEIMSLSDDSMTSKKRKLVDSFKMELGEALKEEGWPDVLDKIWSFGPRKCGPNMLLNEIKDYRTASVWEKPTRNSDPRAIYDSCMINGFQLATLAGPLCEEPMIGVCFVIKKWQVFPETSNDKGHSHAHLGGQMMSACKDACRRAFNQRRPRLVTPMYSCSVLVNSDVLGKLYAVFGRRQGRVISAESALGFGGQFRVTATLPVPESFQLGRELRTQTSGLASPQLVFSHWEVIEQDPYWVPSTEEEYLHFGEKADSGNRAKRYMDAVRRRKGLPVDSQLVTHGEKQRTLSKKK